MAIDPPILFLAIVFIAGFFVINAMRGHARRITFVLGIVISVLMGEVVAVLLGLATKSITGEPVAPAKRDLRVQSPYNG
jgi:hypothetical protein